MAVTLCIVVRSGDAGERVVPIDLLKHLPGKPADLARIDASEVEWSLPEGEGQTLTFDLAAGGIAPKEYDELRFDLKPLGSQVGLCLTLFHHPEKDQKSGWYLKFPAPEGVWSSGRFDLHLDDDGLYVGPPAKDEKPGTMQFKLYRRLLGFPGEPKWRKARFRNARLVKHVISADFDLRETEVVEDAGECACVYQLHVKNRTDQPQKARIDLDGQHTLKYFAVSGPHEVALAPNEEKRVSIKVFISAHKAMTLPPLYSEPLIPVVSIPDLPDSDVYPMRGYRRYPMWGAAPVFNRKKWDPVFVQTLLSARKKGQEQMNASFENGVVAGAEAAMKYDWPVPTFDLPGLDQSYRCPKCNGKLRPGTPTEFHKHVCTDCKALIENNPELDRSSLRLYHSCRSRDVRCLAEAYLITGKIAYAEKAVKILCDYAAAYPKMPSKGTRSTAGFAKLGPQSLHASYVLPDFAEGYALLRDAPCLDETKRTVIVGFLKDEAIRIAQHSVEYSNQQAEHFRAYGTAGLSVGFWPLAAEAIYGDFGWHEVVEYGYSEDGIAHEGGAYHCAVFYAMNSFGQYAWREGLNLYTARFKRVFDGSLTSGLIPSGATSYDLAYLVYGDPFYLSTFEKRLGDFTAALFGVLGVPSAGQIPIRSALMPGAGYIYLRNGSVTNNMEIALNYIKYFDRHERDKFTTFFRRNGRQIDSTVGRITYGSPRFGWTEATPAHNTIVIDGRDQDSDSVAGMLVAFDPSPGTPVAAVRSDPKAPLFKGVSHLRCIALVGDAYVVFDRVVCEAPRTVDRYQWGQGVAKLQFKTQSVESPPGNLPELGRFTGIEGGKCGRELCVDFANGLKMRLVSDGEMEAYKALTVAGYEAQPAEVTFARRSAATTAAFLAVFSFGKDAMPPMPEIVTNTDTGIAFRVKTPSASHIVSIDVSAGKASVKKDLNP